MKAITIFCNEDIIANVTLNFLLPRLEARGFSVHIFLSQKISRKEEKEIEILSKFNFFTKEYVNKIIYPQIEKIMGDKDGYLMTFQQLSRYYRCRLYRIQSTRKRDDLNIISTVYHLHKPYLGLSIRNNLILSSDVVKLAQNHGLGKILNVHSSKLPDFAGVWCALRDMVDGKSLYGTLHVVDEGIDTGHIIQTYSIPLNKANSYLKNLYLIYHQGARYFLDLIDKLNIQYPKILAKPQDNGKRKYYSTPNQEEIARIEKLGIKIFLYQDFYELLEYYFLKKSVMFLTRDMLAADKLNCALPRR